ncbi:hypothetical protein IV203_009816 [Nitzschia inconspicua]|uniref:Uncharacterized protein n=1 Tax=Nitzschia inconspicua TaxID=303405 RepID=A0A9K3PKS9_9STRA|nr:hypothetical protein IV203_009816 [Nitzschia inconspicua]
MLASASFRFLFCMLSLLVTGASALSTNRGPTFSVSEQALFGGYSNGEASLFGAGSVMYGGETLWKGKQQVSSDSAPPTKAPFSGDRVESMTFFVPKTMMNNNNHNNNGSSQSSFLSGK